MEIEFDPIKRDQVLAERGLDMARSGEVFEGFYLTGATTSTAPMKSASSQLACLIMMS